MTTELTSVFNPHTAGLKTSPQWMHVDMTLLRFMRQTSWANLSSLSMVAWIRKEEANFTCFDFRYRRDICLPFKTSRSSTQPSVQSNPGTPSWKAKWQEHDGHSSSSSVGVCPVPLYFFHCVSKDKFLLHKDDVFRRPYSRPAQMLFSNTRQR